MEARAFSWHTFETFNPQSTHEYVAMQDNTVLVEEVDYWRDGGKYYVWTDRPEDFTLKAVVIPRSQRARWDAMTPHERAKMLGYPSPWL